MTLKHSVTQMMKKKITRNETGHLGFTITNPIFKSNFILFVVHAKFRVNNCTTINLKNIL